MSLIPRLRSEADLEISRLLRLSVSLKFEVHIFKDLAKTPANEKYGSK